MNFYVIVTVVMLFIFLLRLRRDKFAYLLLSVFFFFAAFRGEKVGTDTKNYLSYSYIIHSSDNVNFDDFNLMDLGDKIEIINGLICKVILLFNLNYRLPIIIYAAIMLLFLVLACKRFKVNLVYALFFYVLLGYYFISFNIARQLCAASIVLYSLSYLSECGKKRSLFFVWLAIATGIHSMSIIAAVFFLIIFLPKTNLIYAYILFAVSLSLIFLNIDFISLIMNMYTSSHIDFYMDTYGELREYSIIGIVSACVEVLCFYYYLFRIKKIEKTRTLYIRDYIYIFSILFYAAFFIYDGIVSRIRFTLCIYTCLYLSAFFQQKKAAINNKDMMVFCVLFLVNFVKRYQYSLGDDVEYYLSF